MNLIDRLHAIETAVKDGAEHVAATVAEHLPAIADDKLLTAIEDAELTPDERDLLAGFVTATVAMLRRVPQPPGAPVDPEPAATDAADAPVGVPAAG